MTGHLEAASELIFKGVVRSAFEMGWRAGEAGQSLSDALALYDKHMAPEAAKVVGADQ